MPDDPEIVFNDSRGVTTPAQILHKVTEDTFQTASSKTAQNLNVANIIFHHETLLLADMTDQEGR